MIYVLIAYALLILFWSLRYWHRCRRRKRKRFEARIEAARLAMLPVEYSHYNAWGLLAELELDSMGLRNADYLKKQLGEQPKRKHRNQHP